MRVIFCFQKGSQIQYISHLDLQRSMQRTLHRSKLPVLWSQGFHPHPQLSFAMALPVGVTSDCEFMEVGMEPSVTPDQAAQRLNGIMIDGLKVIDSGMLAEEERSLMALVAASRWNITLTGLKKGLLSGKVAEILAAGEIMVERQPGKPEVDIRDAIYDLHVSEDGHRISALLAAGSKNNLQPKTLLNALGIETMSPAITRTALFYQRDGALVPFQDLYR